MKTIVNVYKDAGLWAKPPPGIGDYLRGCAYLIHAAGPGGPFAGRFEPGINMDLCGGANALARSPLYRPGDPDLLKAAPEYFNIQRDGHPIAAIDAFLNGPGEVLYLATNQSWRGLDDEPPRHVLDDLAANLKFTPDFAARVAQRHASLPPGYGLFHIRDADRGGQASVVTPDEDTYCARARRFIELAMQMEPATRFVCISNNERLRDFLCQTYGLFNPATMVRNTGYLGALSEEELMDLALIRGARRLFSLSYFDWSSGFTVWMSRIFGVPALFCNNTTAF